MDEWTPLVPGADATGDETLKRAVVTQIIVFVGMFVFAIIIGIISDEIASKVDEVKTGNNKVRRCKFTRIETRAESAWSQRLTLKYEAIAFTIFLPSQLAPLQQGGGD